MNLQHLQSPESLREIALKSIQAARLGRQVLLDYFGRVKDVQEKFQAGLVSEADKTSEKVIEAYLRSQFPDFGFLGEESAGEDLSAAKNSDQPQWVLDPLDGTTNYIYGFPVFAVSLGLYYRGQILTAVVDAPILNKVYCAWKGGGAYCNGERLKVSSCQRIEKSLLATGFFSEIETELSEQLKIFEKAIRKARAIRRAGSAALDMCWVAAGVFDGYWEKNLKPWDVAAGVLMVQEAGGVVTDFHGNDFDIFHPSLVCGNPTMVQQICNLTKSSV